jgi:hypothetical protein
MGQNTNIGQENSVTVFGNPESFKKLIKDHGILCKIKQALVCPCVGSNSGSPRFDCPICKGDGRVYTYQRRFLIVDENSRVCKNIATPFYKPILAVEKVQNVTSEIQGGIREVEVESFDDTTITLAEDLLEYEKKRITYSFDGWTLVENELLEVDAENNLMYANGTLFDAGYQSSNPLNAFADIAEIVKIWNDDTGEEIENYSFEGKTIVVDKSETIVAGKMKATYYYSDMTQVICTDISTQMTNEEFTHALSAGETRMAFYPYWDVSNGDIIVIAAMVLYKNELFTHMDEVDKLWEMEIVELNSIILDDQGNKYELGTDYILQGSRHIKWISDNIPAKSSICSIRYGYKPAFIIFEDNPQPNNLENRLYPKLCTVKSWSKISKDDIARL